MAAGIALADQSRQLCFNEVVTRIRWFGNDTPARLTKTRAGEGTTPFTSRVFCVKAQSSHHSCVV